MIWQHDCTVIVMLTALRENGQVRKIHIDAIKIYQELLQKASTYCGCFTGEVFRVLARHGRWRHHAVVRGVQRHSTTSHRAARMDPDDARGAQQAGPRHAEQVRRALPHDVMAGSRSSRSALAHQVSRQTATLLRPQRRAARHPLLVSILEYPHN